MDWGAELTLANASRRCSERAMRSSEVVEVPKRQGVSSLVLNGIRELPHESQQRFDLLGFP